MYTMSVLSLKKLFSQSSEAANDKERQSEASDEQERYRDRANAPSVLLLAVLNNLLPKEAMKICQQN